MTWGRSNFEGDYISGSVSGKPLGKEIVLVNNDVYAAYSEALAHGATELRSPEQKPWGQVVSYVRCPSGILLELCTPIAS